MSDKFDENNGKPVVTLEVVLKHAIQKFGTHQKAWKWFQEYNPTIGCGGTPLEFISKGEGWWVIESLIRIEHGMFY